MMLKIDKLFDAVTLGVAGNQVLAMLVDAPDKIVGDADIERTVTMLGENVDIKLTHTGKLMPYWAPGTSPGVTKIRLEAGIGAAYPRL